MRRIKISALGLFLLILAFTATAFADNQPKAQTLDECIKFAQKHHPSVLEAEKKVEQSMTKVDQAKAALLPQVNVSSSYEYIGKTENLTSNRNFNASIGVSYTLFNGGKLTSSVDIAKSEFSYQQQEERKNLNELRFNVTNSYFSVLRAKKLLQIANSMLGQSEAHLKLAKANYNNGMVTKTDVLRAQVQLANDQQELLTKKNDLELAEFALKTSMGMEQNTAIELSDVFDYRFDNVNLDQCLKKGLAARPEFYQIDLEIAEAESEKNIAKADKLPIVSIGGSYKSQNVESNFGNQHWELGITGNMTLYDGGLVKAKVEESNKKIEALKYARLELEQKVAYEIKEAYQELQQIEKRKEYADLSVEQATENLKITETKYTSGTATSIDVIDAQLLLDDALRKQVDILFDGNIAIAKLNKAIGEN